MIVFGEGKHSINTVKEFGKNSFKNILNIEEGTGHGYIGKTKPEHYRERVINLNEIDHTPGNTLFKFKNKESVRAMIDALLTIEESLEKHETKTS